jgi:type II secretory pathway component PulL
MPGKILGLDISTDSVTAVQVTSGLKGYQIVACGRVMIGEDGGTEEALKELLQDMDHKSDTYLISIPGNDLSYRNLTMPFRELKKIRQTLPFEIETLVPFPIEDLVVDFSIIDRSEQSEILAVSVTKTTMSQYLELLQAHGIDPDVLDIGCIPIVSWLLNQDGSPENGLLLDIGPTRNTMVLYLTRRIVLIRTFGFDGAIAPTITDAIQSDLSETLTPDQINAYLESLCTVVQNTIHSFGWQSKREIRPEKVFFTGIGALYPETGTILTELLDTPAEQINLRRHKKVRMGKDIARVWNPVLMDSALALALRSDKKGPGFNLRKDEFEVKKHYAVIRKEIRKVAVLLILVLSLLAADLGVDYSLLKKRYRMLDQKIEEVFRQTFPDVKRIVDPVQQMRVKINDIKRSDVSSTGMDSKGRVLDLIREISRGVPKALDVNITRMVIDSETVRISGKTDTYDTVENIKNRLESSTHFSAADISSSKRDRRGKRIQFEIKLQRAQ